MSVDERVMIELVGKKFPIETFEEEIGKVLKQKIHHFCLATGFRQ